MSSSDDEWQSYQGQIHDIEKEGAGQLKWFSVPSIDLK